MNTRSIEKLETLLTSLLTASVLSVIPAVSWAQGEAPQGPPAWTQMVPVFLMLAVVYVMMIRPQQKREKARQAFVSSLKRGDEVITATGILGRVEGLTEQVVTLEVADGVRIKVLRSTVASSLQAATQPNGKVESAGASTGGKA